MKTFTDQVVVQGRSERGEDGARGLLPDVFLINKFCAVAVRVMAFFCICANIGSAFADTAQNAFVSVTAAGVRCENGRDFAVTGDVARVVANPGWRLRTASEVRLDVGAPAVYRVGDLLGENDADGHIDVIRTEAEDVHVAPPVTSAKASCGGPFVAAASLAPPVPGVEGVEWSYEGDKTCDEFHPDAWAATLWSTSRDAHSKTFLGDSLKATVLGTSATTNFTVVAVDVIIDGADETGEEIEGALVPYVAYGNGAITPIGTNVLQNVKVVCEPKGQPDETAVGIRCSGFAELYEITPSGELVLVEAKEYLAADIEARRFVLHGHRPSLKFNLSVAVERPQQLLRPLFSGV